MAIIPYPSWLPLAQRASKNLTFQTPFRQDVPAVGAPIFQKLTTDISSQWSLTWKFTLAEERAFIQWLRSSRYLNKCNNWFTMMIDLGGSGLQEQTLHFTDYPVQTSIDGGVVTWTGNVIAKKLNNTMDEFDDVLVELDYRWYSWLDEVVSRELPQVYMTPILHMPINMLSSTLDSRIVYDGPQLFYINRNGNLVQSAANEWPLMFIDGVAVGRVPPEKAATNNITFSDDFSSAAWLKLRVEVNKDAASQGLYDADAVLDTQALNTHYIQQLVNPEGGTDYTFSVLVNAYGRKFCRVYVGGVKNLVAPNTVEVDLENKAILSATDLTRSRIDIFNDGWVRVSTRVTTIPNPGGISAVVQLLSDTRNPSYIGDGAGILVTAAQIEKSLFATSPIITEASPITRTAASAKVVMNGATSIDITYSDGSTVNVPAVDNYAIIPQADSAWGSKYITTIKFNV